MARRDALLPTSPKGTPSRRPIGSEPEDDGDEVFARVGERLRRLALGLVATLFVARAYFESEGAEGGSGLVWVFSVLAVAALAVASALLAGVTRLRWSWADAAVLTLMFAVGASASVAADRRAAINLAWEWGGLGLMYVMARNLPRTRGESATLAGVAVATAVAVSAYGLYQLPFEFPALRARFQANPALLLRQLGIAPGSPGEEGIRQRLMDSNEVFSTFALANSLAGFLVGPMALAFAVGLENLRRDGKGSRLAAFLLAAVPGLTLLSCLILTESRSASVGLLVALVVLAWRARRAFPSRALLASGLGLVALLGGLVAAGVASGQLDREVLTEAPKSFLYRWEYWVGTWGVITDAPPPFASAGVGPAMPGVDATTPGRSSRAFWTGVGPGNFGNAYLAHKRPEASEEIKDPHNLILDVWASSGLIAALVLVAALVLALREMLGPARVAPDQDAAPTPAHDPAPPPQHSGWLVAMGSLGWLAVVALGKLNPFQGDLLGRWLILGLAWALAVGLGFPLWRRRPIPAAGLGVATLAIAVNLLAAGGIGIPAVAMMLWVSVALGLNLRDDRPCGRLRDVGGLGPAVVLACVWAALAGTFYGAIVPFWRSEALTQAGNEAMAGQPPRYELARSAYHDAIQADRYNVRPWLALADLEFRYWRSPEGANRKDPHWLKVLLAHDKALESSYRDPNNLEALRLQASYARAILAELPADATPLQLLDLKKTIVKATRRAASVYPTNAGLRAELARASAEIGMYPDAVREGRLALRLDGMMPHRDKKLPEATRAYLEAQVPRWEAQAAAPPPAPPGAGSGASETPKAG